MTQKIKVAAGAAAFALLIVCAALAYNALKDSVKPGTVQLERAGAVLAEDERSGAEDETGAQGDTDAASGDGQDAAPYGKITSEEAYAMISGSESIVLLDVRTVEEYDESHIPGAVLIPDYEIKSRALAELPDKDATIIVYCRSGRRSADAASALSEMGYTNVYDLPGGITDWPYMVV